MKRFLLLAIASVIFIPLSGKANYNWPFVIKTKTDHQQLYREKWEYYGGKADAKVYAAKPFDIRVMKTDLQMYIQSDDDILRLQNKIGYYESCVDYCKGVIKSIDNRGWDIRNATDWKKFEAGMI